MMGSRPCVRAALFATILIASAAPATASPVARVPASWEQCFVAAGARYEISPLLLRAIARQESGLTPHAIGKNTNGTRDIGVMQINSWWLTHLEPIGIDEKALMNPCLNIHVGAWILAQEIARYGLTWTAIGAYHSPTDWRRMDYAAKVHRHLVRELRALGVAVPDAPSPTRRSAHETFREPAPHAASKAQVTALPESKPAIWEALEPDKRTPVDTFQRPVAQQAMPTPTAAASEDGS
jgi:hypothetical protein